ncbi:T9SS type A sorting domain-containing protein [candidate division WOR-3 bacterium]|nr:T9SS type A sorting domain-containing protein [candidate division WOR-3 bacterium]
MYRLIKLWTICLIVLTANVVFGGDTLYLQEETLIDSSANSFSLGARPMVVGNSDTIRLFYVIRNSDTDFVYQAVSNDWGNIWSAPEGVSFYQHPDMQRYQAYSPSAAVDADGYIHLIYEYRGYPLYHSGWPDYPPSHINYVTNETGDWVTYQDVVNDSAIQASEDNDSTISYFYGSFILSKGTIEYFISADYAWWATKYHVVYSDNAGGSWTEGSALVTYDRGAIDKYTIKCASLLSDGVNVYAIWFNRYTGELRVKTHDGCGWGADSTIFTADSSGDDALSYYTMSSTSGNGVCYSAMIRNEGNFLNEIFFIKKDGSGWSVDTISIQDTLYSVSSCVLNDTAYIFYGTTGWRSKLIKHTATGFSTPKVLLTQDGGHIMLYVAAIENRVQPIMWASPNQDTTMWYLYSGTLPDVGVSEKQQDFHHFGFHLAQNYPNPFSAHTFIRYTLPRSDNIELIIYNIQGQLVRTLLSKEENAGVHTVGWDRKDEKGMIAPNGIYFYQLKTSTGVKETRKMLLLR